MPRPESFATACCQLGLRPSLAALAALGGPLVWASPGVALEGTLLERPSFDRQSGLISLPFQGAVPRYSLSSSDNGTRLLLNFMGAQARPSQTFRLGVYHPLVTRIEFEPVAEEGRIRVSILVSQPSRLGVQVDPRRNLVRITPVPTPDAVVDLTAPVGPQPLGLRPGQPSFAQAPPRDPALTPPAQPTPAQPTPQPSLAPMRQVGAPPPGQSVIRRAIPTADGRSVTEVIIRGPEATSVQVERPPGQDGAIVNVQPPGPPGLRPERWDRPLPNEPFRRPSFMGEATLRPVIGLDALVGYALISERASSLGSSHSGTGGLVWGGRLDFPLGQAANLRLQGQGFAYNVTSIQVPDGLTRRDQVQGELLAEWLPVRRPLVLALGAGYWGRYLGNRSNLLAPPEGGLLFAGAMLWHGPALGLRAAWPLWEGLEWVAEGGSAPFMLPALDAMAGQVGPLLSFTGHTGLKYATRHAALDLGYRQSGAFTYGSTYSSFWGGPEAKLIVRF